MCVCVFEVYVCVYVCWPCGETRCNLLFLVCLWRCCERTYCSFGLLQGMDVNQNNIVVWNGKSAEVYEIRQQNIRVLSKFDSDASSMALHGDTVFCTRDNHVVVCNLHGTVKQTLSFTESEGSPRLLSVMNKCVVEVWAPLPLVPVCCIRIDSV